MFLDTGLRLLSYVKGGVLAFCSRFNVQWLCEALGFVELPKQIAYDPSSQRANAVSGRPFDEPWVWELLEDLPNILAKIFEMMISTVLAFIDKCSITSLVVMSTLLLNFIGVTYMFLFKKPKHQSAGTDFRKPTVMSPSCESIAGTTSISDSSYIPRRDSKHNISLCSQSSAASVMSQYDKTAESDNTDYESGCNSIEDISQLCQGQSQVKPITSDMEEVDVPMESILEKLCDKKVITFEEMRRTFSTQQVWQISDGLFLMRCSSSKLFLRLIRYSNLIMNFANEEINHVNNIRRILSKSSENFCTGFPGTKTTFAVHDDLEFLLRSDRSSHAVNPYNYIVIAMDAVDEIDPRKYFSKKIPLHILHNLLDQATRTRMVYWNHMKSDVSENVWHITMVTYPQGKPIEYWINGDHTAISSFGVKLLATGTHFPGPNAVSLKNFLVVVKRLLERFEDLNLQATDQQLLGRCYQLCRKLAGNSPPSQQNSKTMTSCDRLGAGDKESKSIGKSMEN